MRFPPRHPMTTCVRSRLFYRGPCALLTVSFFPPTFFRTPEVAEIYRGRGPYQHDAPRHEDAEYVRPKRGKPGQSRIGSVQLRRLSARGGNGESGARRVVLLAVSGGEVVNGFIALGKPRLHFSKHSYSYPCFVPGAEYIYSNGSFADFIGNPGLGLVKREHRYTNHAYPDPLIVANRSRFNDNK